MFDHHLSLGIGLGEMEHLVPKVASRISPEVGWNNSLEPWMDDRGELALQSLAQQHSSLARSLSDSIELGFSITWSNMLFF